MYMSDISIIVRRMRTYAERSMAHRGLGFPEQLVLMYLIAHGESNQESIAARIDIDRGAITKTVAKLEGKGLVERKVNACNKREKIVAPTPLATDVLDEMRDSFASLESALFAGFTDADKRRVCDALARMSANVQDALAAPAPASVPAPEAER